MRLEKRLGTWSSAPRPIKAKDEDLKLFEDLHKRNQFDKHNIFDDFDHSAQFYRLSSSKKLGSSGFDFVAENEKHDYDWLKTPPATPLFPSIEMEASNGQQIFTQKELPILQPLTRFAGDQNKAAKNESRNKPQLVTKPKPSTITKVAPIISSTSSPKSLLRNNKIVTKPFDHIINSDHDHDHQVKISDTNPGRRARAISPFPRPKPTKTTTFTTNNNNNAVFGFEVSNVTPPNLKTEQRSSSVSRGPRPTMGPKEELRSSRTRISTIGPRFGKISIHNNNNSNNNNNNVFGFEFSNVTPVNLKTEQRSSSVSRGTSRPTTGPKERSGSPRSRISTIDHLCFDKINSTNSNNNNNQFFGSKMVEKVMNARKSTVADHSYLRSKKQFGKYN